MVKGGYPFYGQRIGVLVFDQKSPRVPGDPGHAETFDFPVCYEVVEGKFRDLIVGSENIKERLIQSVKSLESKGIKGIIGDCGLMALYQREMSGCSSAMVFSSALALIPFIWELIGRNGAIGIITGHSKLLGKKHLEGVGVDGNITVEIQGMEEEEHFKQVVIDGSLSLEMELMRRDVLAAAGKLISRRKDIGALLLECSNLATYSRDIYEIYDIPVFDVVAGANLLAYSTSPPRYV